MTRQFFLAALFALTATALMAEPFTLVVPVAASTPGVNDTNWKSELFFHNAGRIAVPVTLTFHSVTGTASPVSMTLAPRSRVSLDDVVAKTFGSSGIGAIEITADAAFANRLAVHSRLYNLTSNGTLGEDVPAIQSTAGLTRGDIGILAGPSDSAASRFNFGLYAAEASTVTWSVIRRDGTELSSVTVDYETNTHVQYNRGIATLLGLSPQDDDTVHASVMSGSVFVYGSSIDESTGDPTYVHAVRVREEASIQFLGVDLNDDGKLDVLDGDQDGVLDAAVTIVTGKFGNYFRIVARSAKGDAVSYSLLEASRDISFIDAAGRIGWLPSPALSGTNGSLVVRASDGMDSVNLTIPVIFR
ncbi:MAG TPA: hypothetical protein VNM92_04810 [Thermoanaerobaculia bacterium]|nr:hypothetical protein [Thermoanaerobaculia bacterium]